MYIIVPYNPIITKYNSTKYIVVFFVFGEANAFLVFFFVKCTVFYLINHVVCVPFCVSKKIAKSVGSCSCWWYRW